MTMFNTDLLRRMAAVGGALAIGTALIACTSATVSPGTPAAATSGSSAVTSTPATATASATANTTPVHLTMWHQWGGGHENDALKAAVQQYEKLHPNVTIDVVPLTLTDNAKILTAISRGQPPDILDLVSSQVVGAWASNGALVPLDDYIKAAGLDTSVYVPAGMEAVTVGGKVYGLPFMNFNIGLLYNKKLFAEAGLDPSKPPATLEELTADAAKLTKQGADGTIKQLGFLPEWPGAANGQNATIESAGWLFGGGWYDASAKKVTANLPANVVALQWETSFYTKYGPQNMANFLQSAGAYLTAQDPLESGKLAMSFDGPWNLAFTKENAPNMYPNLAAAPFPAPAASPQLTGTSFLDTNPQVIPAGSKNPQAAFDFIQWETTNADLTASFAQEINALPQLNTVPDYPNLHDANFQVFLNEATSSNAHVWPQLSFSTEYATKLNEAQAAALYGTKSPQQALDDLQAQFASAQ